MTVELTLTSVYHQPYTSRSRNFPMKAIDRIKPVWMWFF